MAKILFVLLSEIDKELLFKTLEEHNHYFNSVLNYSEDSDAEISIQLYKEDLDINRLNPDIIVTRGRLALQFKKQYKNIPIVEFPATIDDVISSIRLLQKENINNEPIAYIGIGNISYQAQLASQICQIPVVPFNLIENKDLSTLIGDISSKGYKYILGGLRTTKFATEKGLKSAFIGHGRESLWIALTEAKHIARIRRLERERAAHFETILNSSREGIISTDVNNTIIHMNPSSGKILDLDTTSCIGTSLEKVIPDPQFLAMMHNNKEYADELFKIRRSEIVLNKVGISLGNEMIGNVVTFQNVSNVQNTEIKIRSKLYQRGLTAKYYFTDILGESAVLKEAIKKAQTFAKVSSNILIIGNTGTGKELFAQSIHNYSSRRKGPFVAVNCAAIPENLIESEFFGYAGGAFTGASKDGKPGYFELAHEGTIFLDEISEIPLKLQGKLLRVIQESEVMRIGHDKIIPVNVRIICATNIDLKSLVKEKNFREDLFYRLSVLQMHLPPLRERGQDLLLLANHLIKHYASIFSMHSITLSPEAEKLFLSYSWDGNIRELRNVCEQLVVLNETGIISAQEVSTILPISIDSEKKENSDPAPPLLNNFSIERRQLEKDLIIKALKECNYNKAKTASLLCMHRATLWRKLKEYNIECKFTL